MTILYMDEPRTLAESKKKSSRKDAAQGCPGGAGGEFGVERGALFARTATVNVSSFDH